MEHKFSNIGFQALGDLVESCFGAILLDSGFDLNLVWKKMLSFMDPVINFSKLQLNPVRELQELCQSYGWDQQFPTLKKGAAFLVEAKVTGEDVSETACATNPNRKAAKTMAAQLVVGKLKAQGFRSKSKPLEEVLKSIHKMEPKLIGYDEAPIDVTAPDAIPFDELKLQEPSRIQSNLKVHSIADEPKKTFSPTIGSRRQAQPPLEAVVGNNSCNLDKQDTDGSCKKSARSQLYEVCAANYWKPPSFECFNETGPSHLKEFTFKVSVGIDEASGVVVAFGARHLKKKDAAEHAAEGVLWYLKKAGYLT